MVDRFTMVGRKRQTKFPFAGLCGASRCACLPVATSDPAKLICAVLASLGQCGMASATRLALCCSICIAPPAQLRTVIGAYPTLANTISSRSNFLVEHG